MTVEKEPIKFVFTFLWLYLLKLKIFPSEKLKYKSAINKFQFKTQLANQQMLRADLERFLKCLSLRRGVFQLLTSLRRINFLSFFSLARSTLCKSD